MNETFVHIDEQFYWPWSHKPGQCYEMKLTPFRFGGQLVRWCDRDEHEFGECHWVFRNIKGSP